ncbi:NitT/TauT family transport system ATP-binding protein [Inhella inkyongensis]|uniref:NitT/TauT family transport system ATP-binding protein n=1 Tax=Inhella inkyongensis TaxID=392593 RepID=A0A840S820_9BURK|nr:ATP-binding cassette domain-containing protein [Inhella inkyongensis]MBB5205156.1 NitT/TauT family transport system ATP-binding protein [Inhella inkyongensis]
MLHLDHLHLRFGALPVLEGFSMDLAAGERVALLGPSGCGKSSVLRLVGGLLAPSGGRIAGLPLRTASVFQQATLMPWATVRDNVALPLRLAGQTAATARAQAAGLLQRVGLQGFADALPHTLSGGMQMRAALARAWVTDPELLLLDEPFGALDEQSREQLGQELLSWCAARPALACILVTHSVFEAVALADRVLVLSPRPARVLLEIDVRAIRELAHQQAANWTEQDAYFALVRQAQQALQRGMTA